MNYYFVALLLACCAYAFIAGGRTERAGAAFYTLSCLATWLSYRTSPAPAEFWASLEIDVFVIDILIFGTFVIVALRADRYWPIWVSGLLGVGVLGHLARMADSSVNPWTYAVSISIWSYPILASIAIGTFNHHRKKARPETYKSWVTSA